MEMFQEGGGVTGCVKTLHRYPRLAVPQIDTPIRRANQSEIISGGEESEGLQFRFIIRVSNSNAGYIPSASLSPEGKGELTYYHNLTPGC